jgi:hypothetical protein
VEQPPKRQWVVLRTTINLGQAGYSLNVARDDSDAKSGVSLSRPGTALLTPQGAPPHPPGSASQPKADFSVALLGAAGGNQTQQPGKAMLTTRVWYRIIEPYH